MTTAQRFALALAAVALPAQALGASVYLNGTKVDGMEGLANTKIEKCAVEFDAKANVHLSCPGYAVQVESGAPAEPEPAAPANQITRRYFVVTEQAEVGATDYDIEFYVNAKLVRKLRSNEEQLYIEVTKLLTPGKNTLTFVARKRPGERRSVSKANFFRVTVGEGDASADRVMIDNPLVAFERTAADTSDATQDFTITTR